MGTFKDRVENAWKNSPTVARSLVFLAMCIALWATIWPQSPGISIGLLALVAGIMSLRPEMHIYEKAAWVLILIVFAMLEIYAIGRNDVDNQMARNKENAAFQAIVDNLKASTQTSKAQYDTTINHVDGVLAQTQQISAITKQNLLTLTGGDSYAYLIPQTVENAHTYAMGLQNPGNEALTGISITISKILDENCIPSPKGCATPLDDGPMHPIPVPTLPSKGFYEMPNPITPNPDGNRPFYHSYLSTKRNDI